MVERLSSSSNGISRVLVDHLNFIEHMANLHNKALLMKHTLLMCRQTLINHVALIISDSTLRSSFEKSVTDVETFEQIGIFYRTHKKPIEDRSAQYEKYRLISQGTHD
jgi:hypothetical protein